MSMCVCVVGARVEGLLSAYQLSVLENQKEIGYGQEKEMMEQTTLTSFCLEF